MKELAITFLGTRANELGGYDTNSPERIILRNTLANIISSYIDQYRVCGVTSLATAGEQEFAEVCKALDIPYNVYLPFLDQENTFIKALDIQTRYFELLNQADHVEFIKNGHYSPKKIYRKNLKLINEADIVIFQPSKYKAKYDIVAECFKLNKILYVL